MPRNSPHSSTALFRGVAVAVLFLTTIACGLQVLGVIDHTDPSTPSPALYAPVLLTFIGGLALATLLEGIARLVAGRMHDAADAGPGFNQLLAAVIDLKVSLPEILAQSIPQSTPVASTDLEAPPAITSGTSNSDIAQHLERMVKLLEEMKEVSMLDETQRLARRKANQARRKTSRLEEADRFIQAQDWRQADAVLHLLESLHPEDAQVQACRTDLDNARIAAQAEAWDRLGSNVHDLLALSNYADAIAAIVQFLDRYPAHTDARQLGQRIAQEQAIFIESTTSRLYDQIKSAVEHRKWRSALDGIQVFLDKFPDHPRAAKIRQQIRVIQKNAEIEERHEQEDRIRELINAGQFTEAADLSEDLLRRFPDSPQAAYLTGLLPKLRERSTVAAEEMI